MSAEEREERVKNILRTLLDSRPAIEEELQNENLLCNFLFGKAFVNAAISDHRGKLHDHDCKKSDGRCLKNRQITLVLCSLLRNVRHKDDHSRNMGERLFSLCETFVSPQGRTKELFSELAEENVRPNDATKWLFDVLSEDEKKKKTRREHLKLLFAWDTIDVSVEGIARSWSSSFKRQRTASRS